MANTSEITNRMKSIKDTMKITSAMYLISSAKLRKAKISLENTEPYFLKLQLTIARILRHLPNIQHPYFDERTDKKEKKYGLIVVTADKGLAGAYNHNVLSMAEHELEIHPNTCIYVLGELGRQYFDRKKIPIDLHFHYTVQNPTMSRARHIAETILTQFINKNIDEVSIIYTRMVNAVTTNAEILPLLPLKRMQFHKTLPVDVPMEEMQLLPDPYAVIKSIVPCYIAGSIYGALVLSYCSEQNSRMVAMEAATKSGQAMLDELTLIYNRIRQSSITQELTEVIGGAKALKRKKQEIRRSV